MNEKQKKQNQSVKKNSRKVKFYYSFLTVVLLVCLVQVVRSAVLNVYKILNYNDKVKKMTVIKNNVEQEHESLINKIDSFSTLKGFEAIARNKLKLAQEDEILVIVNNREEVLEDDITNNKNLKSSVWVKLKENLKVKDINKQ